MIRALFYKYLKIYAKFIWAKNQKTLAKIQFSYTLPNRKT